MSLDRQCPPDLAKTLTENLLGDPLYRMPVSGSLVWPYFASMSEREARREAKDLELLPEGFRVRDLQERMGEDRA